MENTDASISLENHLGETNIFDTKDPRVRILYFGFTECPDICPTSLAILAAAFKKLPESTLDKMRPIFISLDPQRDDGKTAMTYAQYFHPNFEGVSGDISEIQKIALKYQVLFQKSQLNDSEMDYAIDHSSNFYFTEPDGTLIYKIKHTLNPNILVKGMEQLVGRHFNENI